MKQTTLITGGSGRLALNWALAIRERHAVTLALHARNISLSGVQSRLICLEELESIFGVFDELRPDLVVHTAGMTSVEECEENPELARNANVRIAQNIATVCSRLGLQLVHISTDHLFSGEKPRVEESHPVAPQNVYARTKAEAELRILETYPDALVVRTNFYGWGPSYRKSFSDVIVTALRRGERLTLFQDVFYTPIIIEALVESVHELVNREASGIIHVVGDERISKHQFGLKVAEHFRLESSLVMGGDFTDQPDLVQRPRDLSLSNRKARDLLGRNLGGIDEQLERLFEQERLGLVKEVQSL